jgi:hypothetical protein
MYTHMHALHRSSGDTVPCGIQGYLAPKKLPPPPRALARHGPVVGFWGEAVTYKRGTPVLLVDMNIFKALVKTKK